MCGNVAARRSCRTNPCARLHCLIRKQPVRAFVAQLAALSLKTEFFISKDFGEAKGGIPPFCKRPARHEQIAHSNSKKNPWSGESKTHEELCTLVHAACAVYVQHYSFFTGQRL